jgi:hypothetical protein
LLKILYGTLYTDYKHIYVNDEILGQPFKKQGIVNFFLRIVFLPKDLTVRKNNTII